MVVAIVTFVVLLLISLAFTAHTVQKYKQGVVFRLGCLVGERSPGLVTMPIESHGIITRDNLSVDVSAVSCYRVLDTAKSAAIENIEEPLNEIARTTLRQVIGQHTLDDVLAETSKINVDIQQMLDLQIADWGVLPRFKESSQHCLVGQSVGDHREPRRGSSIQVSFAVGCSARRRQLRDRLSYGG